MTVRAQNQTAPRLVIADDETGLDGAYFAALGPDDVKRWGNSQRWLPGLDRQKRSAALADYQACMEKLDARNQAQPAYWRTALGIRDVEKSLLFNGLEQLWRLEQLLRRPRKGKHEIHLLASDPAFARLARRLAARNGWQVTVRLQPVWRRWISRLRERWQGLGYLLSLAAPRGTKRPTVPGSADIIIATVSTLDRITGDSGPRDFIFGQFPGQLAAKGKRVAMFAQLVGETRMPEGVSRSTDPFPIRTFADLAGPLDALRNFFRAQLARIHAPKSRSSLGLKLTGLIASDIARARWQDLPSNMLLEHALGQLIKASPNAVLLHSFENNAWESVCQDLARRHGIKSVGLQHNALIRSHLKLYRNAMRPAPDAIIVSGPVYRQLLCEEFGYDTDRLVCGFAIRQLNIFSDPPKSAPPDEPQRILVMLQQTLTSPLFLDLVRLAFKGAKGLTVTLRPHPAIPLADMLQGSALRLRPPFRKSSLESLQEDLDAHDIAVCGGTTAELEAVAHGVPCVFVDTGETVSANPLFAEHALNVVAGGAVELRAACEHFATMTTQEFTEQREAARTFVEGAFSPPSAARFKAVLETLRPHA